MEEQVGVERTGDASGERPVARHQLVPPVAQQLNGGPCGRRAAAADRPELARLGVVQQAERVAAESAGPRQRDTLHQRHAQHGVEGVAAVAERPGARERGG